MSKEFKLVGLSKLPSHNEYMAATLEYFDREETVDALIEGDNNHKDDIWNYCENNWGNLKAICIEDEDGQLRVHKVEHIN